MFNVTLNGEVITLQNPTRVVDLLPEGNYDYCTCKVNNRLRELTYVIDQSSDIQLIDLSNHDGMRVHEASLRYIFVMALKRIEPEADVVFKQFISQSLSCEFINLKSHLNQDFVARLKEEMDNIIKQNYPIVRKAMPTEEAVKVFNERGYHDKTKVTRYRPDKITHYYECAEFIDYMFNYMIPSTGFIRDFKVLLYYPLVVLQYPRYDTGGFVPEFVDSPKLCRVFRDASEWANRCGATTISSINEQIENGLINDFVNMCETHHNNMLADLGRKIYENASKVKIVAVAGPSSSGKTTFTNRLRIELLEKGLKPLMISIDDYYLPKHQAPLDKDGKPDLEHIEALDIALFNQHMLSLIQGETVTLPHFNFKTGKREMGRSVKLEANSLILIEGIHALNDRLTPLIPKYQKFKVYISPLTQVNIDSHNPISITDVRLLRRLVRDFKHRNTSAPETFGMWSSVRKGEYTWIYPRQEEADYIFNSELAYEFGVMKKYALPLLEKIPTDNKYFIIANRLIKFLKYFKDIDDDLIPSNSILREFIGGSCFK